MSANVSQASNAVTDFCFTSVTIEETLLSILSVSKLNWNQEKWRFLTTHNGFPQYFKQINFDKFLIRGQPIRLLMSDVWGIWNL